MFEFVLAGNTFGSGLVMDSVLLLFSGSDSDEMLLLYVEAPLLLEPVLLLLPILLEISPGYEKLACGSACNVQEQLDLKVDEDQSSLGLCDVVCS
jgi:hypothetical protein